MSPSGEVSLLAGEGKLLAGENRVSGESKAGDNIGPSLFFPGERPPVIIPLSIPPSVRLLLGHLG